MPPGPPANNDFQQIQDDDIHAHLHRLPCRRQCATRTAARRRQQLCVAGERGERRSAGPAARQPRQSRRQLPGAENPGQRCRRCAHARERPALSHAGADRSGARLDRRRRAVECGARRSAWSSPAAFPPRRSRRPRDSASSPSSSTAMSTVRSSNANAFELRDASDQPVTPPACVFPPAAERGRGDRRRSRSRPAAINSPCTATDPHRSPMSPVTCSTATSTASPAATCSFRSMSNPAKKERPMMRLKNLVRLAAAVRALRIRRRGAGRTLPGGADGPEVRAVPRESHRRRHAHGVRQRLRANPARGANASAAKKTCGPARS